MGIGRGGADGEPLVIAQPPNEPAFYCVPADVYADPGEERH